jgi:hypothetical protein
MFIYFSLFDRVVQFIIHLLITFIIDLFDVYLVKLIK